jgi:glycosyltransferase involved in cell wall biosynthesis
MTKLSVVIITLNEEDNIGPCIDSVQGLADEVIVVDSFSTDRTVEVAKQKGAKVFQHTFEGYTKQKNIAIQHAAYDYVFSIDADEKVSSELQQSIFTAKQQGFTAGAYEMNRLNFFGNRAVKTCGWYPDVKVRLWNKHAGGWQGGLVHEQWVATGDVRIDKLKGDLLHYSYKNAAELKAQVERFAALAAQGLQHKSPATLVLKLLFSTPARFIKTYIVYRGFTDGATGFTICYYLSAETCMKYYKAIKLKYA